MKKENRGGARPGTGPKKKEKIISDRVRKNYQTAAAKIAKEMGFTIEEYFLRMLLKDDVQDSVKASIMKTYNEAMIIKVSEQNVDVTRADKPQIYLPEVMEKPPEATKREKEARALH